MTDQSRNLNAHAAAHMARILWGEEYSQQRGGCMDFWDQLSPGRKMLAAECADVVRTARPYTGPRKDQ